MRNSLRDHILFYLLTGALWLLLSVFINFIKHPDNFLLFSLNDVWDVFYITLINFIFFEYSIPFIRKKRTNIFYNILTGILLISLLLILLSFGLYGWNQLGILIHIYKPIMEINLTPGGFYNEMMYEVSYLAEGGIASFCFFGIAWLLYNNIRLKFINQQQQIGMREAELNFLKSQTNPHFLFNTLNNIYSLATDKSDLAPESILRLSKILRFMLYETAEKSITIKQELEIIQDYIALEKLRYDETLDVQLTSDVPDMKLPIHPLLMIPLIENAFKHVSEDIGKPFVNIDLQVVNKQLTLVVKNSSDNQEDSSIKENIGLANLRRQLQLLYSDHELSVEQMEDTFTATLQINLLSDVYDKVHNSRR